MTLLEGTVGRRYGVENMQLPHATELRLQSLGLTDGTKVEILNKKKHGCVMFKVRGTRLAVGKEIAESIEIKEDGSNG